MQYFIDGKLDRNGVETSRRAKAYSEQHGCDYTTALRAVIRTEQAAVKR